MKYSIMYSSKTGNTAMLAEIIKGTLPKEDCNYFGELDSSILDADIIFIGFWTYKGSCDENTKTFLHNLNSKKIFLFGTAGFVSASNYYENILNHVKQNIAPTNTIVGSFMCQGKMPVAVLSRYEKMLAENPNDEKMQGMINNFNSALNHPDQNDLIKLKEEIKNLLG